MANNAAPSAAELANIYAGTTIGAPVTPTGGASPYTATLTGAAAGWATTAPGRYYVYAILNPDPGVDCRQAQEIIVTIVDRPDITANSSTVCESAAGAGTFVVLTDLVQNPDGSTLTFTEGGNPVVQPLPVGVHTITVRGVNPDVSSCFTEVEFTVEVLPIPVIQTMNGTVCSGGSIDLATLVTNTGGGTLSYHATLAAARTGTPALASSTVSPASATNYYVRSVNSGGCSMILEITITIRSTNCGTISTSGPYKRE